MRISYTKEDVCRILTSYREIFPAISPGLRRYWDLDRKLEWSWLTTDFHAATYEILAELSAQTERIDKDVKDTRAKGNALAACARTLGMGFSIGISPWTDHGLFSTYSSHKNAATVVLAHDWYPIVPAQDHPRDRPLYAQGLATMTGAARIKYHKAVPGELLGDGGNRVLLFLNLYPHYREPGDYLTGKLPVDYDECRRGVRATLEAVCQRFNDVQLISWGTHTWDSLRTFLERPAERKLSDNWVTEAGQPLQAIRIGARSIRYLPLAHPSHPGNFCTKGPKGHLAHVERGFAALIRAAA